MKRQINHKLVRKQRRKKPFCLCRGTAIAFPNNIPPSVCHTPTPCTHARRATIGAVFFFVSSAKNFTTPITPQLWDNGTIELNQMVSDLPMVLSMGNGWLTGNSLSHFSDKLWKMCELIDTRETPSLPLVGYTELSVCLCVCVCVCVSL